MVDLFFLAFFVHKLRLVRLLSIVCFWYLRENSTENKNVKVNSEYVGKFLLAGAL